MRTVIKLYLTYFSYVIISFTAVFASTNTINSYDMVLDFYNKNINIIPKAFYLRIAMFKSKDSQNEASKLLEKFMSEFKVNYYDKMQIAYIFRDIRLLRNTYYSYLEKPTIDFLNKNHMYGFIQKCQGAVMFYDFFSNNRELLYHDACKFYNNLKDDDIFYLIMMVYAFHKANDKDRFEMAYNKLSKAPISNNLTVDAWRLRILKLIGKDKEANIFSKEIRKVYTDKSYQDILDICESAENEDIESTWNWSLR